MTDQRRIRLAEAMGYTVKDDALYCPEHPGDWAEMPIMPLPNPFTDANDDYAVLEWMRGKELIMDEYHKAQEFYGWLRGAPENYQIGDYARAALKVLE